MIRTIHPLAHARADALLTRAPAPRRAVRVATGLLAAAIFLTWPDRALPEDVAAGLIVHEWGTFTSLQDEEGRALVGVNIDDEPVPDFVHDLSPFLLDPTFVAGPAWTRRMKGTPRNHPYVTMRLETPVLYFYRPKGATEPMTVDVGVRFRQGWLTEFYPRAKADAPDLRRGVFEFGAITDETVSSLDWKRLRVGTDAPGPETDANVWTTPRAVSADGVTTEEGESERYLFYRGVARIDAPLRVTSDFATGRIDVWDRTGDFAAVAPRLWLVEVDARGHLSFEERRLERGASENGEPLTSFPRPDATTPASLDRLEARMHAALVEAGLFDDEATAMLGTWHRAYFESAGRRLFYVVPRAWTDRWLPLDIPAARTIERVMIGRVELVTEEHRELLAQLAASPVVDARWVSTIPESPAREAFLAGRRDFGDLGVEIPDHYRTYLRLGRFRNALVVDAARRNGTEALDRFIGAYELKRYDVTEASPEGPDAISEGGSRE